MTDDMENNLEYCEYINSNLISQHNAHVNHMQLSIGNKLKYFYNKPINFEIREIQPNAVMLSINGTNEVIWLPIKCIYLDENYDLRFHNIDWKLKKRFQPE